MNVFLKAAAALAVATTIVPIGTAQATSTVIGFQPLMFASSVPVTYTESGYTIQSHNTRQSNTGVVVNSTLTIQKTIGADGTGIPGVNFARSTSFTLTGGTFTFDGLSAFFGQSAGVFNSFTVLGSLLDKQLYSQDFTSTSGTAGITLRNIKSGSSEIFDKLVFTSGSLSGQLVLDDIKVSAATIPTPPPSVPGTGPGTGGPTPGAPVAAAVPEPATWAMMILGFGVVGASMRRRPKVAVRFA